MMDITVVVSTYGDQSWQDVAFHRAIPSADNQTLTVSMHSPNAKSLGEARNNAVDFHDPQEWICFLDADDQLAPGFIGFMEAAEPEHVNVLLTPALQFVTDKSRSAAVIFEGRDMAVINPCPIGTLIHRAVFEEAGRFWDERAWEDWSLFRRAWLLDAEIRFVPDAVYRAHLNPRGRNSTVAHPQRLHKQIIDSHEKWALNR